MSKRGDWLPLFDDTDDVSARDVLMVAEAATPDPAAPPEAPEPFPTAPQDPDEAARVFAVSPDHHVVLEASAGTGKTSVLVARYVNLLKAGVDPANILAITFTRKAAAEMRERIVRELRQAAALSEIDKARWLELRDRLGDIAISTIDAFCLSLLREFPLEADLDPGFEMADETEVPRLIGEALDQAMRIFISLARTEPDIALVLAQLGTARTREGLASLLDRRLVAWEAIGRFLARGPADLTTETVCRRAIVSLHDVLRSAPGGLAAFLAEGPSGHPRYQLLRREIERLPSRDPKDGAAVRGALERIGLHFLTLDGTARKSGQIHPYRAEHYPSAAAAKSHRAAVFQIAPFVEDVVFAFNRDLNAILARGIRRMFGIALAQYRRALEDRSVLDFSDVLQRALDLLRQMDEFAQSRFRLEARYHHVLVDEFQDTSRAQWELVSLLIKSWGEGLGLATRPSIFIVGDRKQSIYRFRDAEVAVLQQAARFIEALRPEVSPRRSISRSFRAVPGLLELVNEVCADMGGQGARADDFTYGASDRFPIDPASDRRRGPALGIYAANDPDACASAVAAEIARILREDQVRDRETGVARQALPGDIAILFRSRASHREFQRELEARGIPAYVYKGLGFFDADETKDLVALVRFLARPVSDLRAAALLRSRFVRLSDPGLATLGRHLSAALIAPGEPAEAARLTEEDRRVLDRARTAVARWLPQVDRIPPAELVDAILAETAYAFELRGPRRLQAWENLKKMRALIRRMQNRGYATFVRIADHLDALTAGDESNAVLEALDAVNLMTVHAAKGLEFPIVFVVNMAKGASGPPKPVRVIASGDDEPSVSISPFVSDTDEANREREKHETRRLLYVALTRARDRLYLSSALKEGRMVAGRGSLAEVLPPSIRDLFERAGSVLPGCNVVAWPAPSGKVFEWYVCPPSSDAAPDAGSLASEQAPRVDRFGPATASAATRPVTDWLNEQHGSPAGDASPEAITTGILVHRLFQAHGTRGAVDPVAAARTLTSASERAALQQPDDTITRAAAAWNGLRDRPDVRDLFDTGQVVHELPFTLTENGVTFRGRIDCLIRRADGTLIVVELKTGAPAEVHRRQLEIYVRAARAMFPHATVESRLIYADGR